VKAINIRTIARLTAKLRARGFTFIELMVAIVVLIVIAALVLPSLESASDASRFKSACDQLSSAASICRAEAKRTGKPVAVVATRGEDGRQTIVSVPLGEAEALQEHGGTVEVDSRVLMVMPHGVSVETLAEGDGASQSDDDMTVTVSTNDEGATQSLIIYWANGEATASPIVVKGHGRSASATVNSWTGAVSIGQEPAPTTTAAAKPEADEPDAPEADEPDDQTEHEDPSEIAKHDPYPVPQGDSRNPDLSMEP